MAGITALKAQLFFAERELAIINDQVLTAHRYGDTTPHWKAVHLTTLACTLAVASKLREAVGPEDRKPASSQDLMQAFALAHQWVHLATWEYDDEEQQYCTLVGEGYKESWLDSILETAPQYSSANATPITQLTRKTER